METLSQNDGPATVARTLGELQEMADTRGMPPCQGRMISPSLDPDAEKIIDNDTSWFEKAVLSLALQDSSFHEMVHPQLCKRLPTGKVAEDFQDPIARALYVAHDRYVRCFTNFAEPYVPMSAETCRGLLGPMVEEQLLLTNEINRGVEMFTECMEMDTAQFAVLVRKGFNYWLSKHRVRLAIENKMLSTDWNPRELLDEARRDLDAIQQPTMQAIPLLSLHDKTPDANDTLLGNRFLCREGSMLFVGPSGVGKSSAATQQDLCWSVGKPAFGIIPARPLKILQIQAENDAGDLHEMVAGVWKAMEFGPEEEKLCTANLHVVSEKTRTGSAFLSEVVRPLLRLHRPDIIRIDPLLAFLGDDPTDTKALAAFCRSGLNPLLEEFQCAVILNHHTPKTTNRDTTNWRPSDWMYSGAGGAELANWARAILVIEPTDNPAAFRFIGAKRTKRLEWYDKFGNREFQRIYCHSECSIAWRPATETECDSVRAKKDKGKPTELELMEFVPAEGAIDKEALLALWNQLNIGQTKCKGLIAALIAGGKLFEWRVKRSGTRDKIQISRRPQEVA